MISVLWSGAGLVAVDKPPGVPVVPGRTDAGGAPLREQLEAQLGRRVWVVHRLDRYRDRVRSVTREEARAAAEQFCFPQPPLTVAVGPAERLRPQLERFGTVEVLSADDVL